MAVIGVKREEPGKRPSATTAFRARRCLFGRPTDQEQTDTMSDFQDHERLVRDEKRKQWNFDFEREQPLPGRWQWEPVRRHGCQQTPPGNSSVDRGADDARPTATASSPPDAAEAPSVSSGGTTSAVESPSAAETVTPTEPRRKRRRQTTLTGTAILC